MLEILVISETKNTFIHMVFCRKEVEELLLIIFLKKKFLFLELLYVELALV